MSQSRLVMPIFVSSPGDMTLERQIVKSVVEELNERPTIKNKYVLDALLYEQLVPPTAGDFAQMIVDRYMRVETSYIVIGMFWSRMGTAFKHPQTREAFESGTDYEIKMAYRASVDSPTHEPHLLLYHKVVQNPQADPQQQDKVGSFFKRLREQEGEVKGLYQDFSTEEEFRKNLLLHIEQLLLEAPPLEQSKMSTESSSNHQTMITNNQGPVVTGNDNHVVTVSNGKYIGGDDNSKTYIGADSPEVALLKREIKEHQQQLLNLNERRKEAVFQAQHQQNKARALAAQKSMQNIMVIIGILVASVFAVILTDSVLIGIVVAALSLSAFALLRKTSTQKSELSLIERIDVKVERINQTIESKNNKITKSLKDASQTK